MADARLGALFAAAGAALAAGCALTGGEPGPTEVDLEAAAVSIPLSEGPDGLFVVDLFLGGRGPRRFLFDTGSGVFAVDPALAEALGLPGETASLRVTATAGSRRQEVRSGRLDEVSLRAPGLPGVRCRGVDYRALPAPHGLDGIAGLGLFPGCLVTLDPGRGELQLRRGGLGEPDGLRCLPSRTGSPVLVVAVSVCGIPFEAALDTGFAGTLYLPRDLAARLRWREGARNRVVLYALNDEGESTRRVVLSDAHGPREVEERRLDGLLRFGDLVLPDPWVYVGEGDPLLGTGVLRGLRVTFDMDAGRVLLESSGSPP